jgi:DNA-binding Xre family transcriptional regulator
MHFVDFHPERVADALLISTTTSEDNSVTATSTTTRKPHQSAAVIAARVRELREKRCWSAARLAREMQHVGVPWERVVVTKLETGRRESVTVVELLAIAAELECCPLHLLVLPYPQPQLAEPGAPDDTATYWVTPTEAVACYRVQVEPHDLPLDLPFNLILCGPGAGLPWPAASGPAVHRTPRPHPGTLAVVRFCSATAGGLVTSAGYGRLVM